MTKIQLEEWVERIRTAVRGTLSTRTSQPTPAARPILNRHIRRTSRRTPRTNLLRIACSVQRSSTHLPLRCETARVRATRTASRIADGPGGEFAGRDVTAGRIDACAWVTVFALFDNSIAAHLEREGHDGGVGVDETGGI